MVAAQTAPMPGIKRRIFIECASVVADGVFTATTQAVRTTDGLAATQYLPQSDRRNISVLFEGGRVLDTQIAPGDEATTLSDPAVVPAGVPPLNKGFARLADATSCAAAFAMYDGCRVVQITTATKTRDGGSEVCTMDYRVTAGPGHLSPFRFKSLGMTLTYTDEQLGRIALSAAGFKVQVVRRQPPNCTRKISNPCASKACAESWLAASA